MGRPSGALLELWLQSAVAESRIAVSSDAHLRPTPPRVATPTRSRRGVGAQARVRINFFVAVSTVSCGIDFALLPKLGAALDGPRWEATKTEVVLFHHPRMQYFRCS